MNNRYTIGIDIGGTNTDAVLIDQNKIIVASSKVATTENITDGFKNAVEALKNCARVRNFDSVLVGTTHATNALLQAKDLYRVGVIRIAGQKPLLPPCYTWPDTIKKAVFAGSVTSNGGFECQGSEINKIDQVEIEAAVMQLLKSGAESIAVIGVFSPINSTQEELVCKIIKKIADEQFPVTISSAIGGVGFIERENSTILNCALQKSISKGFQNLRTILDDLDIQAPLFFTQNNGTVIDLETALAYPILTISAGPTNSFVGAVKLAGLTDAIVVDIGGTSTDIGIVQNGFARRTTKSSEIAGIPLNFSMPDVISIALGGGSFITAHTGQLAIGPESAAHQVLKQSQAFGGDKLTLTDIAIKLNYINIPGADPELIKISEPDARALYAQVRTKLQEQINKIAGPVKLPVILVGGGAALLSAGFLENSLTPEYSGVANAYGAALAEISGTIDTVVSLDNREEMVGQLRAQAITCAITNGAQCSSVRIVNQQIIPYHYVPNNLARVIITAAGQR